MYSCAVVYILHTKDLVLITKNEPIAITQNERKSKKATVIMHRIGMNSESLRQCFPSCKMF